MPKVHLNKVLCKGCEGCGLCVAFCRKGVLKASGKLSEKGIIPPEITALDECTGCKSCMIYCPDLAIVVEGE